MMGLFAALHESAFGPKRTWCLALHMSAFGGKADIELEYRWESKLLG